MTKTIAFYAPLKSPNHETPSGDRLVARLFISLFEDLGYKVNLISELRSWSSHGSQQINIKNKALQEATNLAQKYESTSKDQKPILWFTYHLYHKAPDWIGPFFCQKHNIPYLIAEASIAPKRERGEWALGYQDSLAAIKQASYTLTLAPHDQDILSTFIPREKLISFLPFTQRTSSYRNQAALRKKLATDYHLPIEKPWLLTVAMMRNDCKKKSYFELIESLSLTKETNYHALFIGAGEAQEAIKARALEKQVPVTFLGQLPPDIINDFYQASDLYLWPAINEAYGMSLLEAQVAGLPVIAGDFGSVSTIVDHQKTGIILPPNQPHLFADSIDSLLHNPECIHLFSTNALKRAADLFSLERAKKQMKAIIETVTKDASNV